MRKYGNLLSVENIFIECKVNAFYVRLVSSLMAIQWGREQKSKLGGSKIPEYCSNFLLNHHVIFIPQYYHGKKRTYRILIFLIHFLFLLLLTLFCSALLSPGFNDGGQKFMGGTRDAISGNLLIAI